MFRYSIGAMVGKGPLSAHRRDRNVATKTLILAAFVIGLSGRTAGADSGSTTDNALATLCGIVEASAKAQDLPAGFFTRLIWRESAFRPSAVSPAGAQGVAQFMPRTAAERGLANPFDPATAIPESAKLLAELAKRFGNLGLAAAAYNAGPTAVDNWLAGAGALPFETQDYVLAITGDSVENWRAEKSPVADPVGPTEPCLTVIAKLRVASPAEAQISGLFAPWGVQIAASFSKESALRAYARAQHDYASVIGDMQPFVLGTVLRSRGWRPFYRVRLPAQTGGEARRLCGRIQAVGGACAVLRS